LREPDDIKSSVGSADQHSVLWCRHTATPQLR
jgi:hypothetical protein